MLRLTSRILTSAFTIWIPSHTTVHIHFSVKFLYLHSLLFKACMWISWSLNNTGIRGTETCATENPPVTWPPLNLTIVSPLYPWGIDPEPIPPPYPPPYQNPWMLKSLIQNGIKQIHTVGPPHLWVPNRRLKILCLIVTGWICRCKTQRYGGTVYWLI